MTLEPFTKGPFCEMPEIVFFVMEMTSLVSLAGSSFLLLEDVSLLLEEVSPLLEEDFSLLSEDFPLLLDDLSLLLEEDSILSSAGLSRGIHSPSSHM